MISIILFSFCEARNAIFGFATGYAENVIAGFVGSTRRSGYRGEIWLGVNAAQIGTLRRYASGLNVRLVAVDGEMRTNEHINMQRFRFFSRWSHAFSDADWILTCDVRDTFVQRNPFSLKYSAEFSPINLFEENANVTIGACPYNSEWIRSCWGEDALKNCAQNHIVCAGNILARAYLFRKFVVELSDVKPKEPACSSGMVDQGALNYLRCTKKWDTEHNFTVRIWKRGTGVVNTIGSLQSIFMNHYGEVLNDDATVSPIVHQYDRHNLLTAKLSSYADDSLDFY